MAGWRRGRYKIGVRLARLTTRGLCLCQLEDKQARKMAAMFKEGGMRQDVKQGKMVPSGYDTSCGGCGEVRSGLNSPLGLG